MNKVEALKKQYLREDDFAIESAVSALTEHAQGRKFLWWLLQIGRVGDQPFSGNALGTAFNCGELNVGQRILDRIVSISPEGYILMMKENADERRKRDDELGAATDLDRDSSGRGYDAADREDFDE